ncbi:MAG: hypothetical protein COV45_09120 [Deltaproteobacteria bacterium CG11_big_fil_rev_8_21_14_0_20_47_16]|nr:MAG: hypothetical protein COV45_09120 [Deltaproteobacteria bacterium CG11_big_fil_rev_8_21_14_0_20_47_16]
MEPIQVWFVGILSFLAGWGLSLFLLKEVFRRKELKIKTLEEKLYGRKGIENAARPHRKPHRGKIHTGSTKPHRHFQG